jgi:peptide/nickel transport system permease protein
MGQYIVSRIGQSVLLLLLVSIVTFTIIREAPGMPAVLVNPDAASAADVDQGKKNLGLDDPLAVQYLRWLSNAVRGELGDSYQQKRPVTDLIMSRIPATLLLSGTALALALLIAVPLGIISAIKPYGPIDYAATLISFIGVSIPVFWFGIMLIILFSVRWGWLPSGGMYTLGSSFSIEDRVKHLILPVIVLSSIPMAQLMRFVRSSMRTELKRDYLRVARGKGLQESTVLWRHGVRNAMIPVVTVFGLLLPATISGAPVTESIFSWPGMGRLAVDAAFQRDYPLIMGVTLFVSVMVIATNLVVDVAYAYLDPRIKLK